MFVVDLIRYSSYIDPMPKARLSKPTDAELGILTVLWKRGALTVREVHEATGEATGYTTTLKQLQVMTDKGLVVRNEAKRAHVYQARYSQQETQQVLLSGLLNRAFSGSTSQLVIQALASKRATQEELAEIKKLIEQLTRESK
jgi:predicted transcriptional regulator